MYNAYIVEVKEIREHSNADRLNIARIFDCNVIVDKSVQIGDKGIFFPVDGQLSEEYCRVNNLVRIKNDDGTYSGGYLDPAKRNVKAMNMRGERSEGLYMPLSSLESFGDVSVLKVGDVITTFNGHEICCKYIPRGSRRNNTTVDNKKNKKKVHKEQYPYFAEHIDTPQLKYNPDMFKPGELIIMTEKLHGCFTSDTKVNLWGRSRSVPISKIKIGDIVVGCKDGQLVPSKVVNTFINGRTDTWRKLLVTRNGLRGEKHSKIVCTPNHLFYDKNTNDYIEAKDLKVGQHIYNITQSIILPNRAKSLLVGMILGDGSVLKHRKSISVSQKIDKEEYLDFLVNIFDGFLYKDSYIRTSGYGTKMLRLNSKSSYDFKNFVDNIFADDGINKLNENIIEYFNWESLALLYMDDGSLSHNDNQQDRANIAICSYNTHDADIIVKCLQKLGLDPVYYVDKSGYSRIRLNKDSAKIMFDNIYKFIPNVMRYKLPEQYRSKEYNGIESVKMSNGYVFVDNVVVDNKEITNVNYNKYDIETETHNYCVNGIVVHNSSHRIGNTLCYREKNIFDKLLHRSPTGHYKYISGTRRTIRYRGQTGFYGNEEFRDKWDIFFENKLQKGEIVYGEIVGAVTDEVPIMPDGDNTKLKDKEVVKRYGKRTRFSYGCDISKGENDFYIYRMTKTDDEGNTIEYTYDYIKLRAEQMGAKVVPEFERFIYTTQEDMMERVNKYLEGCSTIDSRHTREGIVLRADGMNKYKVAKIKSYIFSVLEGLIKEDAVEADIEEAQDL